MNYEYVTVQNIEFGNEEIKYKIYFFIFFFKKLIVKNL